MRTAEEKAQGIKDAGKALLAAGGTLALFVVTKGSLIQKGNNVNSDNYG